MSKIFLATLVAAALLSSGVVGNRAEAVTLVAPGVFGVAAAQAAMFQRVVNICGTNGCAPVQTKRVRHYKPGSIAAQHI